MQVRGRWLFQSVDPSVTDIHLKVLFRRHGNIIISNQAWLDPQGANVGGSGWSSWVVIGRWRPEGSWRPLRGRELPLASVSCSPSANWENTRRVWNINMVHYESIQQCVWSCGSPRHHILLSQLHLSLSTRPDRNSTTSEPFQSVTTETAADESRQRIVEITIKKNPPINASHS